MLHDFERKFTIDDLEIITLSIQFRVNKYLLFFFNDERILCGQINYDEELYIQCTLL